MFIYFLRDGSSVLPWVTDVVVVVVVTALIVVVVAVVDMTVEGDLVDEAVLLVLFPPELKTTGTIIPTLITTKMIPTIPMIVPRKLNYHSNFLCSLCKYKIGKFKSILLEPFIVHKYWNIPGDILDPLLETPSGNFSEPNLSIGPTDIFDRVF